MISLTLFPVRSRAGQLVFLPLKAIAKVWITHDVWLYYHKHGVNLIQFISILYFDRSKMATLFAVHCQWLMVQQLFIDCQHNNAIATAVAVWFETKT